MKQPFSWLRLLCRLTGHLWRREMAGASSFTDRISGKRVCWYACKCATFQADDRWSFFRVVR